MAHVKSHPFPLVFATISGAHLYGFPSPDSDFDLRGVHLLPLNTLLSLDDGQQTVEKEGIYDGLEIDLVTMMRLNSFGLMLRRNGYVLEQLLSPLIVFTTPEHDELKIARAQLCHPASCASLPGICGDTVETVRERIATTSQASALYVRVLLTGIHLMKTGEVEANLCVLNQSAKLSYLDELVYQKQTGAEKGILNAVDMEFYRGEYLRLTHEWNWRTNIQHCQDANRQSRDQ